MADQGDKRYVPANDRVERAHQEMHRIAAVHFERKLRVHSELAQERSQDASVEAFTKEMSAVVRVPIASFLEFMQRHDNALPMDAKGMRLFGDMKDAWRGFARNTIALVIPELAAAFLKKHSNPPSLNDFIADYKPPRDAQLAHLHEVTRRSTYDVDTLVEDLSSIIVPGDLTATGAAQTVIRALVPSKVRAEMRQEYPHRREIADLTMHYLGETVIKALINDAIEFQRDSKTRRSASVVVMHLMKELELQIFFLSVYVGKPRTMFDGDFRKWLLE